MSSPQPTPRTTMTSIRGWQLGRTLGRGAYAHVRLATHSSGHVAACKILPSLYGPNTTPPDMNKIIDAVEAYKEVVLLKGMAGAGIKGIVGLEGLVEEDGWTYIFLEVHHASATSIKRSLGRSEMIRFFRELCRTIQSLHSINVSHEDLKRSNILVDHKGHPVLLDFGFSHLKADGGLVRSAGGTLDYSSPEKVIDDPGYDPKANDVWSLGIILIKLMHKPHPFMPPGEVRGSDRLKYNIVYSSPFFSWGYDEVEPGGIADLIMGMLDKDPRSRLTIQEILDHPALRLDKLADRKWRAPISYDSQSLVVQDIVLRDVAFLCYLNGDFVLCESFQKIRNKLASGEKCWEKFWAGSIAKWKKSFECEWEDCVREKPAKPKVSTPTRKVGKPLREIHLSTNIPRFRAPQRGIASLAPAPVRKPYDGGLVKIIRHPASPKDRPPTGPVKVLRTTDVVVNSPHRGTKGSTEFERKRFANVRIQNRLPTLGSSTLATLAKTKKSSIPIYTTGGLVSTAPSAHASDVEDEQEDLVAVRKPKQDKSHQVKSIRGENILLEERRRSVRIKNKAFESECAE